jgi:hypothetical protein
MANNNKPPMFGPSAVLDTAGYVPRSGKSFRMAATDLSFLADKSVEANTVLGNCTTTIAPDIAGPSMVGETGEF